MPIYKDGKTKNSDGLQKYKVRVNYQDIMGRNKQLTRVAWGLQEAKSLEIQLQAEQKSPAVAITVNGAFDKYYEEKSHSVRETTLEKIVKNFNTHILPTIGDIKLSKLNVPTLQEWKMIINEKDVGVTTKKNIYGYLRNFLNWCVQSCYIQESPLKKIENFRDPYSTPETAKIVYYTPEEFKQYSEIAFEHASTSGDHRFYTFFMIAYYTGMRKGEINALKWSDIEGSSIHVRRSIAQKLKGEDRETPPKNKTSYRTIQAPLPLQIVLDAQ